MHNFLCNKCNKCNLCNQYNQRNQYIQHRPSHPLPLHSLPPHLHPEAPAESSALLKQREQLPHSFCLEPIRSFRRALSRKTQTEHRREGDRCQWHSPTSRRASSRMCSPWRWLRHSRWLVIVGLLALLLLLLHLLQLLLHLVLLLALALVLPLFQLLSLLLVQI